MQICTAFFYTRAFVLGRISDLRRYERERARRATGRATYLPTHASDSAQSPRSAHNPARLASPSQGYRKGNLMGRRSRPEGPKYADPTKEEGIKGAPRRGSTPHPRVRAAGRAAKGRAARRGYTPRCREPDDSDGEDIGEDI